MKRSAVVFILLIVLLYSFSTGNVFAQYGAPGEYGLMESGKPGDGISLRLNDRVSHPEGESRFGDYFKDHKDNTFPNSGSLLKPGEKGLINAGGIFLAPWIGIKFPIKAFRENSNTGLDLGVRLEFAHSKIYPVVVGIFYESQSYNGSDEFKTQNVLGEFKTGITAFGGSVDVILSKYIRSDFTIPFIVLEAKYMKVTRTVNPPDANLNVPGDESLIGYSAGAGFTLFIFDIIGTYTFAQDFSTFGFKARFHFPLIKF